MEEYSEETIGQANSSTKGQCPHWAFGTRSHGVRADGQWQDRGLSLPHHHGHDSQGRQDIVAPLNRKTTIIMAPTRELAQLIFVEGQRFTYATGTAPVCIYGGADVRDPLRQIERGCDLLVATLLKPSDPVTTSRASCAKKGFPACSIHGDKSQWEREDLLRNFKRGDTPVMVATDVASRGLDNPNVTQVVNYDLPTNIDDYVHRIGRTGRAGMFDIVFLCVLGIFRCER